MSRPSWIGGGFFRRRAGRGDRHARRRRADGALAAPVPPSSGLAPRCASSTPTRWRSPPRAASSTRTCARGDPLTIRGGRIRITGIEHPDQVGAIEAQIDGGVAETLALLRNPRLRLLDKHPFPVRDPAGHASVKLSVRLPLEDKVKIDDIAVRAQAHLENVHLGDIAAGRSLDQGKLDLDATNDGLKVNGQAMLAGIDADLAAEMDFRAGPPAQVMQKVTVSGRASAQQIAAAGLDAGPLLSGTADLNVGTDRAPRRAGRVAGRCRPDPRGPDRRPDRLAQARREPGEALGAAGARPRPSDRHRRADARRQGCFRARPRRVRQRPGQRPSLRPARARSDASQGHRPVSAPRRQRRPDPGLVRRRGDRPLGGDAAQVATLGGEAAREGRAVLDARRSLRPSDDGGRADLHRDRRARRQRWPRVHAPAGGRTHRAERAVPPRDRARARWPADHRHRRRCRRAARRARPGRHHVRRPSVAVGHL